MVFDKRTIADYIYEKLLEDIISLHYAPGEKLSEAQLAARFEVSKNPVRKALTRLEKENFVIIKPQYGTFVSELSIEKGKEICDVRLLLETYAARIAAENITDEQIQSLQASFDHLDSLKDESEEYSRYVSELDIILHGHIFEACGNNVIREISTRYSPQIQRIRRANIAWVHRLEPTLSEMKKIFEALKHRDAAAAEIAMKAHIQNIKTAITKLHH